MLLKKGQVYLIKKKKGKCCECFRPTRYWLCNASNYFCLNDRCFLTRNRWYIIKTFIDDLEKRFQNASKFLTGEFD